MRDVVVYDISYSIKLTPSSMTVIVLVAPIAPQCTKFPEETTTQTKTGISQNLEPRVVVQELKPSMTSNQRVT